MPDLEESIIEADRAAGIIWAVRRTFTDGRVDYLIDPPSYGHFRTVRAPNVDHLDWQRVSFG